MSVVKKNRNGGAGAGAAFGKGARSGAGVGFAGNWVWIVGAIVLCGMAGVVVWQVKRHTGGHWSYPLDDTYIHMALARNLAFYHNWGITHDSFAGASSSLLYSLLLALLFKLFSVHLMIPLVVNALAGIGLVFVLQRTLAGEGIRPGAQLLILLGVIVFTPLPILVVSGMEHTLQCLFSFLFIYRFAAWAGRGGSAGSGARGGVGGQPLPWSILWYALLMVATRYECLFLVGIAGLVLLWKGKWRDAFLLGGFALLPVIAFGVYSISKGSYFLPNSILLKSGTGEGIGAFINSIFIDKLTLSKQGITGLATQRLLLLLPLFYLVFRKAFADRPAYGYVLLLCTGGTLLHLCLASTGWLYRYEAYLVLNSVMIMGILLARYAVILWEQSAWINRGVVLFLTFFLSLPLVLRSTAAFSKVARASLNIYEQQYQMGLFLQHNYDHSTVAANDIGAISYLSDIHTLDLWGLGNIDVARSKRNHTWTPSFLDSLSRVNNVRVAIVYDSWFAPDLLKRWTKVGTWTIPQNVICGDETVSFYAIDPSETDSLRQKLQEWAPSLPAEVKAAYY